MGIREHNLHTCGPSRMTQKGYWSNLMFFKVFVLLRIGFPIFSPFLFICTTVGIAQHYADCVFGRHNLLADTVFDVEVSTSYMP